VSDCSYRNGVSGPGHILDCMNDSRRCESPRVLLRLLVD
jgi:hypothetical protein